MTKLTVKKTPKRLLALEKRVDDNFKAAWYQNGLILMKIRDDGDYKEIYGTFENYLSERWDFSRSRGYQLLDSASLTQKIAQVLTKNDVKNDGKCPQIVDKLPANEGQIRPLISDLKTDSERVTVWQNVVEASKNDNVKITAAFVQQKVDEFIASGDVIECLEFEVIDTSLDSGSFHISGKVNDWYTPVEYIESARYVMGSIDLDPASSEIAQQTVNATQFYTIDNCGLKQEWEGNTWLNPPYSMPEIQHFIDKLLESNLSQWIVLTNNSSDTGWFHKLLERCSATCFTKGRVGFISPTSEKMATRQGQTFFYYGENKDLFISEFSQYGAILEVCHVDS